MKNLPKMVKEQLARVPNAVRAVPVLVGGVLASSAHAAGGLGDAITTELTGGKTEILAVGAVVLGLIGTILLIKMIRRSAG